MASEDCLDFFYNFSTIFWALSRAGIDQPADMPSARSFGDLLIGRHQPPGRSHCFSLLQKKSMVLKCFLEGVCLVLDGMDEWKGMG